MKQLALLMLALMISFTNHAQTEIRQNGIIYTIYDGIEKYAAITDNYLSESEQGQFLNLIIPDFVVHNGFEYQVKKIEGCAFLDCQFINTITIANSVTSIGDSAFEGCRSMTSVGIPNSITFIGDYAFYYCESLTSVKIPNSIVYIGDYAFLMCSNLVTVESPQSVSYIDNETEEQGIIGEQAFDGCNSLKSVEIPNSITSIGARAFSSCKSLTSVSFPNSVITIGESAFSECGGLTSLDIPNSVTTIDNKAFSDCVGLTSINISNSVIAIGKYAFCDCKGLTSVKIPNSVKTIGEYAFAGCENISSVEIPNSLTSICEGMFWRCSCLTEVIIPSTVTSIGYAAFDHCSNLTTIEIPHSVTDIDGLAFSSTNITSMEIPSSVKTIGNSAFACCNLTSIEIPNSVIHIGKNAFFRCTNLESVKISNSISTIEDYTFYDCDNLKSVEIPNSIVSIGNYAFSGCNNLTEVEIPNSVTYIGEGAFSVTNLSSVQIPNSVTYIGERAFSVTNLSSVQIPNSVTYIGKSVFRSCGNISNVKYLTTNPIECDSNIFDSKIYDKATLFIDNDGLANIKKTNPWKLFKNISSHQASTPAICFHDLKVEIVSNNDEKTTIYYTLDETEPNENSSQYNSPLNLEGKNVIIKAKSYIDGLEPSNTATFTYTHADYVVKSPTFSVEGDDVTIAKVDDESTLWYAVNDSVADNMRPYDGKRIVMDYNGTVYAQARRDGLFPSEIVKFESSGKKLVKPAILHKDGMLSFTHERNDVDIIYAINPEATVDVGYLKANGVTYEKQPIEFVRNGNIAAIAVAKELDIIDSDVEWLQINEYKVDEPKIAYRNLNVEITQSDEDGVSTHYTLDGSEPTEASELYVGPIGLSANTTVRARSFKKDWNPSDVVDFIYTHSTYVTAAPAIGVNGTTVTITATDAGSKVWYAINYDDPAKMKEYTAPLTVDHACVIYAQARKDGFFPSEIASHEIREYKLTYMVDGNIYKQLNLVSGVSVTPEPEPVKEGHTFSGWDNVPETMPAHDVTVNGTFSTDTFKATFVIDGETIETRLIEFGAVVTTPDAPAKEGHTFSGWQDVPETMPAHDITVNGSYTVNTYTLTYIIDGVIYKELTAEYGAPITPEADPIREGETFSGWQGLPETMPAHDVTVTGSFSVNTYMLTYLLDGEVYKTSQVAYGTALTVEADPTKEGHTFGGWQGLPRTMPAHDVTVTGTFSVNSYKLTYKIDNEVYAEYTIEYGSTITPEPDPVREGYTFSGWIGVPETMPARDVTVNGSFSNTVFNAYFVIDGETIETRLIEFGAEVTTPDAPAKEGHTFAGWQDVPETMPAHDITVTGSYSVNSYRLTYMVDGVVYKELTVEYGAAITPEADPVREGETFSGWQGLPETMPAHDVTVTGSFGVNTYTLTYMLDGEVYRTSQVAYGAALTVEADPAKEGHTFSGWQGLPQTMPAHDVTVTGTFSVNSYMLTYMVDGEVYAEHMVEFGAAITPEADPVREGYTFSGWIGVPDTMPARDVTVNGSFSNTVYKATFVIDGETIETRLIEFGAEVTTPDAPAKEGHTFAGWQDVPETMPAHDITITGSYTVNKYTLTYMLDGEVYKALEVEYGAAITPEADPVREGYTFSGWVGVPETMPARDVTVNGSFSNTVFKATFVIDGETIETRLIEYGAEVTTPDAPAKEGHTFAGWQDVPATMPAHDITVTGSYTVNKYRLTYMVDGEVYAEYTVEYGAAITLEPDPVREGETFSGWQGLPDTMPAHDVTVTGSFGVNTYTLTYILDGEVYKTSQVAYGAALTPEADPTKEGHTFSGWHGLPKTMPAHDVTVTGSFDVNTYTLTYMLDGEVYKTSQVAYGTALTVEADPTKEGHTFGGWQGLPRTMPAHDVTVTGTFSVNSYKLTYKIDNEVYAEYTVEFGAAITPEDDPVREGYTFSGWAGVPETMPARDVTVNGSFSNTVFKATFVIDGETIETRLIEFGAVVTTPDAPEKEGHTFAGWQEVPATMPAHDITVNGSYTVNKYRLTYMVDGEVYAEYTVEYSAAITPEPDPVREGEAFSGWQGLPETMPAHDVTVTGSFGVNTYTLTYILDGEVYKTSQVAYGTALTAEADPAKEGHTFSGWHGLPQTMPAYDVTVTGSFSVNSYKLTYKVDDVVYAEHMVEFGAAITPEADPVREGYTFSGWVGVPETMPARDVTVNGSFSNTVFKATFVIDGETIETRLIEFGAEVTTPDAPEKEGHTFGGWQDVPATMPAHDITITGSYTVNTYTLTYMLDGEVYKTSQVTYGAAITPEPDPTKEGHTFSGWQGLPQTMPTHDVTVTGSFSVNSYMLTYMVDGEVYAEHMVEFGAAITPEADPVREGYTFSGWVGVPDTMPARDVTVNGSFSNTVFKATFVIDGETIETRLIEYGAEVTTPDAPAKEGHTFAGWQDVPATMPAHDITITGSYSVNSYRLTYMVDGVVYKELTVEYGAAITPEPDPVREGETFSGWQGVPETMPAHDVTVTGSFGVNTYTLTYMLDGEVYRTSQVSYGAVLTAEADPTKEGHTFSGWHGLPQTMPAHDVTVTGSFSVNSYRLTYILDGEPYKEYAVEFGVTITPEPDPVREGYTFSGWVGVPETMPARDVTVNGSFSNTVFKAYFLIDGETIETRLIEFGAEVTVPDAPEKEGHTFAGWQDVPTTMPAHDITITGSYTVNTYTLTYLLDGEVYRTSQVAYGTALTAEADPTKEGHTFGGWQGLPRTMPAHDVTVTGAFSINSYKLTYKVDGEPYKEYTVEFGAAITPEADPVREGYTFSGWVGVPDTMPAKDITVNGSFSNTVFKATFVIDGETIETRLIEFGAVVTTPDAPAKEGHTFAGWQDVPTTMPAHDITITGSYTVNTYTLTYTLDGEVYRTSQAAYGTALTAEADPTKEGHTFGGWQGLPRTMPAHDVTVTGSFSINSYKLTYKVDGEVYKEYTVEFGAAITPEPDPVREGYTFSGWDNVPEKMPAKDVTVNGSFSNTVFKATFVIDGETIETRLIEFGAEVTTPDAPAKEGHTFAGWQDVPTTMPAHDITVTGSYTVNAYTLTYILDGQVYRTSQVAYGTALTAEADPTKEGHTFGGWQGLPRTMPAHDVTVSGTFSVNSYRLTYMVDGEGYAEYTVEYGAAITPEPEPTKEGHTFSGWDNIPETMPAHDVTVSGTFSVNSYRLTYMIDGEVHKEYTVEFGATITPEPEPTKEGHTFSGWVGVPETMPAHDVTVSGSFMEKPYSAKPQISHDGRFVTIGCEDQKADILFTIDNVDMTQAWEYGDSFDALGLHTIRAFTVRDGFNDSETAVLEIMAYSDEEHAETAEEGHLTEAFGWMPDGMPESITDYSFSGPLNADDYAAIRGMKAMRDLDLTEVTSTMMPDEALKDMELLTVKLPKATEAYGEGIFTGNDGLCAIFANSAATIPAEAFGDFRNPNLLLYASEEHMEANKEGSGIGWLTNVIADGKAASIPLLTLTDAMPYFCPKDFDAQEIRFTKSFSKRTSLGGISGWETMAVPFNVSEIRKGEFELVPFKDYDGDEDTRPFWLYTPGGTSWVKADAIEAHTPYLISMPNNEAYEPSYNITGDVTFIGGQQVVNATPEAEGFGWKAGQEIWTNFSRIPAEKGIYVVNDNDVDGHVPGGAFVEMEHDVRPFECYVTASTAKKVLAIFDSSDIETLRDFTLEIWSERYDLFIRSPYTATFRIFDLNGQLVRMVKAEAGATVRVADLTPGIYFVGDRKVLVK